MTTTPRLPPLPRTVSGPAGPIRVVRRKDLRDEHGVECDGLWSPNERKIFIASRLELPRRHQVLCHEKTHRWLDDVGVLFRDQKLLEQVCDAMSVGMMHEFWWNRR